MSVVPKEPHPNCFGTPNPDQADSDSDGVGDACDDADDTEFSSSCRTDADCYVDDSGFQPIIGVCVDARCEFPDMP